MKGDPLDKPASLHTLQRLRRDGVIGEGAFREAAGILHPPAQWLEWVRVNLLLLGAGLVLSGIVFFFAYNWQEMNRFQKLGLVQIGILGCSLGAWWAGLNELTGKVLLLGASVLVGVFLAVFGQIYQTGADAYELFTGWAALILVWVMISRFAALWYFWLVLIHVGLGMFWFQVAEPSWGWKFDAHCFAHVGIDFLALAAREKGLRMGFSWLSPHWLRVVLVFSILAVLSTMALWVIFGGWFAGPTQHFGHLLAWFVITLGGYFYYRYRSPDFACLALAAADIVGIGVTWIGRLLLSGSSSNDIAVFLFMFYTMIIIGSSAVLSFWLARQHKAIKALQNS